MTTWGIDRVVWEIPGNLGVDPGEGGVWAGKGPQPLIMP